MSKTLPPQLDILEPKHGVQVEYDRARGVLYVHVDGYSALRICRIPGAVEFLGDCTGQTADDRAERAAGQVLRELDG